MSMFSMISLNADARLVRRLLKRVQIDHHHVDRLDPVLLHRGHMLLVPADVQNAAVHLGMQRLYAAVQHLRKSGQIADVAHTESGLAQRARRPAGRDQLNVVRDQGAGELDQAGLVGYGEKRAADAAKAALGFMAVCRNGFCGHATILCRSNCPSEESTWTEATGI